MIHYPHSIRYMDPILHTWCMHYDAKHNFFRQQLKRFKNITVTLVKKHQRYMAMYHESLSKERLICVPGKIVTLYKLKHGATIAAKFGTILSTSVFSDKWIKYLDGLS